MTQTVVFAGGGTAGHVFPAVAVARELEASGDWRVVFVGTPGRLEARLVPEAGFPLRTVDAVSLPRRPSSTLLALPAGLRRAVRQARQVVREERPVAVATFGGYVSYPVSRAAHRAGLPLLLHEQNSMPGLANRLAARWADRVAVTFPGSVDRFGSTTRTAVTGNPVRSEILQLARDRRARRDEGLARFGLEADRPTVLVFGGSQGARSINRATAETARLWGEIPVQFLHAAGTTLHDEAVAQWEGQATDGGDAACAGPLVRVLDFIDDMALAYAVADIVVCRAGATSIAELSVLGLPSVLVPYPGATRDHQLHNALALAGVGGAVVIEDDELSPRRLAEALQPWLVDVEERQVAADRALAFGRPEAARLVVAMIESLVTPPRSAPGAATTARHVPGVAELPDLDEAAFDESFEATRSSVAAAAAVHLDDEETVAGLGTRSGHHDLSRPGPGAGPTQHEGEVTP